jgi:hypothetical protein
MPVEAQRIDSVLYIQFPGRAVESIFINRCEAVKFAEATVAMAGCFGSIVIDLLRPASNRFLPSPESFPIFQDGRPSLPEKVSGPPTSEIIIG